MTTLVVETIEMPTAALGPCSPLPMLDAPRPIEIVDGKVPAEIAARSRQGLPPSLLPYLAHDDYGRQLEPRPMRVAVLENDALRATVALDVGARLWSLYDRLAERELLYVNPVLQPANLALRNAWCSGGVEWNIGTRGHSPTTMDTLHAAQVDGPDGQPMLRLWEWERLRNVVFQVDLWLPNSSTVLLARTRIRNLNETAVPMYWWSNAAVGVGEGVRVFAPADRAFRTHYPDRLGVVDLPDDGDRDLTFPSRHRVAADLFFDIASDWRPWIAAVDDDGSGIAHVSTGRLRGRKLFVWGTGRGGERWQQWLSHGGDQRYAEIQAGLAPTQYEHLTMPGQDEWAWTEAFGAIAVDAKRSHGSSWGDAVAHLGGAIDGLASEQQLADWHQAAGSLADSPSRAALATGSGWGALERHRRQAAGEPWFDDTGTPFPDESLGSEQDPWLALLRTGELPSQPTDRPPRSYVTAGDWAVRLAAAPPSWLTNYHLAVIAHGAGDRRRAVDLYRKSLRIEANAWSLRGLAEAASADGRRREAAEYAVEAARLAPQEWRLTAEAVGRLLDDERPLQALDLLNELPSDLRSRGRLRLLEAWAAALGGRTERAGAILVGGLEVADLREGERSVDELWRTVFPDRELPAAYDFRMVAVDSTAGVDER